MDTALDAQALIFKQAGLARNASHLAPTPPMRGHSSRGLFVWCKARDDAGMDRQTEKLNIARRQLNLLTTFGAALLVAIVVYAVYTVA